MGSFLVLTTDAEEWHAKTRVFRGPTGPVRCTLPDPVVSGGRFHIPLHGRQCWRHVGYSSPTQWADRPDPYGGSTWGPSSGWGGGSSWGGPSGGGFSGGGGSSGGGGIGSW